MKNSGGRAVSGATLVFQTWAGCLPPCRWSNLRLTVRNEGKCLWVVGERGAHGRWCVIQVCFECVV